jgi:hypothetical protein
LSTTRGQGAAERSTNMRKLEKLLAEMAASLRALKEGL